MRSQNCLRLLIRALAGCAVFVMNTPVAPAQMQGFPEDWTHHHVVFSNPGTLQSAIKKGSIDQWLRTVNDPRYQIQQMKRAAGAAPPVGTTPTGVSLRRQLFHVDWTVALSGGSGFGVGLDMYAAKYTFSPIGDPDCVNDFVVFPINNAGDSSQQANLMGTNNLYNTTCSGTVPTILFAYFVGTGKVQTSPVLSLDGTKVAFVESVTNGSIFHVLTLDKSGNSGCPNSPPCNGTAFNSTAVPGINNSAVDTKITMSGNVSVTLSSPFVDYTNDFAYVGDDNGKLHLFTGVFLGTPAEVTTVRWPVTVDAGRILTAPTYDSISGKIFVGGSGGNLWCVLPAGTLCSPTNVVVGSGTNPAILDAPIVDSTQQRVFAAARTDANVVLSQATTALASQVTAAMGTSPAGAQDIYNGAFDSAYFADVSTGHMYFCGDDSSGFNTLLRVTFNSLGVMSSTPDSGSFALTSGFTVDCTPLTEILNTGQGHDYLFLGVYSHGFKTGTPNCNDQECIMNFDLPTAPPFTFPVDLHATTFSNIGPAGLSGIIIDNVSGFAGASQVYFGALQTNIGVQASQLALQ